MTESPAVSVPHVETARLLLRELRVADFDAYAEHLADPIATAHLSRISDRRMAWRTFAASLGF
jgi:RimJ/RimL family protein N-acetyltransferase